MSAIYQTTNYNVIVGTSKESGTLCYQVVNKNHGVIEVETHLYPQAIKYASDLEAGIQSILDGLLDTDNKGVTLQ